MKLLSLLSVKPGLAQGDPNVLLKARLMCDTLGFSDLAFPSQSMA